MAQRRQEIDEATLEVLEGIENADDPRSAWMSLARRIEALRESGREVPIALVAAERQLITELQAASQGR